MDTYIFCLTGIIIVTTVAGLVIMLGIMGGFAACMLSSRISQELGEE